LSDNSWTSSPNNSHAQTFRSRRISVDPTTLIRDRSKSPSCFAPTKLISKTPEVVEYTVAERAKRRSAHEPRPSGLISIVVFIGP
jgi:hypothetical protein